MNRKMICVLVCILAIWASDFSATAINIPENLNVNGIEQYITLDDYVNENETGFWTLGPLRFISKITFQNGSTVDLLAARFILRRNILPRLLPFTFVLMADGSLDFTVEYRRSLLLGNSSRLFYFTNFGEVVDGNLTNETTLFNVRHVVRVEGFTGIIAVFHRSLSRPQRFLIVGNCESVTLLSS